MLSRDSRPQGSQFHGSFIPSIEGMRALAVLVVLLFHLDIPGFDGGYLGVDLFFVISGFIISRNILQDLRGGRFSLREFYVRRFRRLFPALLVTVLFTLVVALVIIPPQELADTAESAIYALFSLANFHFWLESGYFDAAADAKPLLHTWSLSVEEQFYLFWPALLLLLATTQRRLFATLLLLGLSLGSALLWRDSIPDAIFYLLPFRLHQLMAGALIAILSLRLLAPWGNLSTLIASAGFLWVSVVLNGGYSPAVGAAAVTGFGFLLLLARESALAQLLYANKPMQWIGQRSYALYLVHWPIIVLFKFATDFQLNVAERALLLGLCVGAAAMLHEWVEKPFRKRGEDTTTAHRIALPATFSVLAITVCIAAVLWRLEGIPDRFDPRIQHTVASVGSEKKLREDVIRFGSCNLHKVHQFSDYDVDACAAIDPTRRNVLVLGDSIAADTYMMLLQTYPEITFSQATAGACTALLQINDIRGKYPACEQLNAYRFSELAKRDMDLIVLASLWTQERIAPLQATIDYLHSIGKNVLVIGPRVSFAGSVPLLLAAQPSLDGANLRMQEHVVQRHDLLADMRAALPQVEIIDMGAIQCTPECKVLEGEHLLYFDAFHFTQLGAKRVGAQFRESFDLLEFIDSPSASAETRQ